jgi:hypothetical protein
MARWACQGTTRDGNGRVIAGATVSVYLTGTNTVASIYAAEAGGAIINSVTSDDTNGAFIFYVDDVTYATTQFFRVVFSKSGYETRTFDHISIVGAATAAVVTLADAQTLTNKTLTEPIIASFFQDAGKTQLMTVPNTASDTLAALDATQTFANKTLTTPIIPSFYQDVAKTKLMTVPNTASDTLVALAATQTLAAKTLTTPTIASFVNATHTHLSVAQGGLAGLLQVVNSSTSALISGTTQMPVDDTIPQITEGFEVITCAITPKSATSILIIIANIIVGDPLGQAGIALFQDATAGALAAVTTGTNIIAPITLVYKMISGTVSATTFRIRIGAHDSGTIYVNNIAGATGRIFGGVASTTLTIFECTS